MPSNLTSYSEEKLFQYCLEKSLSSKNANRKANKNALLKFFKKRHISQVQLVLNMMEGVEAENSEIEDNLSVISGMSVADYKDSKEIKIQEYNKKRFVHGNGDSPDPISIDIKIKNI